MDDRPCTAEKMRSVEALLSERALPDIDGLRQQAALDSLATCGPAAWPLLRRLLRQPTNGFIGTVIKLVVKLGDEESYPAVFEFLSPEHSVGLDTAAWAVGELRAFDRILDVVKLLTYRAAPVREAAEATLNRLWGFSTHWPQDPSLPEERKLARIACLSAWPNLVTDYFERVRSGVPEGQEEYLANERFVADNRPWWIRDGWEFAHSLWRFAVACRARGDPVDRIVQSDSWRDLLRVLESEAPPWPETPTHPWHDPRETVRRISDLIEGDWEAVDHPNPDVGPGC